MPSTPSTPQPFYHPDSGSVRFWVLLPDGRLMGAIARQAILHHCFQGTLDGEGALAAFAAHRAEIETAVRTRAAGGSIEPVLLRESDFATRARR